MDMILVIIFLIFFIIILISYFDLLRYYNLQYRDQNDELLLSQYASMKRIKTNCKIIISFTTIPKRIHKIKPMITSLFKQTVRVDNIILNLPSKCKGDDYDIPSYMSKMVHITKSGQDYGPATKCIPTLLRESDYGTMIILLDDDFIYGEDFIEKLILESIRYPNCAIFSHGGIVVKPEFFVKDIYYLHQDVGDLFITDAKLRTYMKVESRTLPYINNYRILRL